MSLPDEQTTGKEERSIGDLFADLARDLSTLIRQELTLARTEMSQKLSKAGRNIGFIVAGGGLAYGGFLALIAALILILTEAGLPMWASALLVGFLVIGLGAWSAMKGIQALRETNWTPRETIESLTEDPKWAQGRMA